nr:hypothetical protein BaRGS_031762 [Batillaria attramentaria]
MCRTCRRLHDKFTDASTHKVQPLKAKEKPPKASRPKTCQIHLDQSLCLHCVKCDISICMLCKLTSHEGHATEDMARANERAKEELKGLLTKANEQIQVVDTKLCHLDRRERELVRQKQEVTREVNMRYEKAVSTIARARDDAIEDLASREQAAIGGIRAEKMSARNTVETLSGLLNRARNETDVVSLKNEVQAALLSEEALDNCRQAASNEANSFFVYQVDVPDLEWVGGGCSRV